MTDSPLVPWIQRIQIISTIIIVIWATYLIGAALPEGHKYEDGWIFGLAWLPILVFATIEIVTLTELPQTLFRSIGSLLLPYMFVVLNMMLGHNANVQSFIIQSATLQFTASMLAFALQGAVFPLLFKKVKHISMFLQEEAFTQLFGATLGFIVSFFAFSFLLSKQIISPSDLPLLFLGILQSAIPLGLTLYRIRE